MICPGIAGWPRYTSLASGPDIAVLYPSVTYPRYIGTSTVAPTRACKQNKKLNKNDKERNSTKHMPEKDRSALDRESLV